MTTSSATTMPLRQLGSLSVSALGLGCMGMSTNPRFRGEAFAKNLALVAEVERIAKDKGCTTSQLALA